MRKLIPLFFVLTLIFAALSTTPNVYSAADSVPPQVLDTQPVRGEELSVDGGLTLLFDQPMDKATVEAAFKTNPPINGTFTWLDDATVRFQPSAALERAAEYGFIVEETAHSAEGVALRDRFTLKLRTVGYLEVVQILPENGTPNIAIAPTITVIFNRPVVPLVSIEEMKNLPNPLTIAPPVEGTGEWLSTSIYTFKPKDLKGGTDYTLTVKAGLTDVTGSVLRQDVTTRFSTISPRVTDIRPDDNSSRQLLDPVISVAFSQPMDRATTEAAFVLSAQSGKRIAGTFTWNERSTRLNFKPDALLEYDSRYFISIDTRAARSTTGALLSDPSARSSFRTIDLPRLVQTYPRNETPDARESGLSFRFSGPMNLKDFKKRITITPEPKLLFTDYGDDDGYYYTIAFSHEPSTSYIATLDPTDFKDRYGTPLVIEQNSKVYDIEDGKLVIRWSTPDYPPEASLRTGGRVGMYSAYNPTTRIFSTHRNINSINLSLSSLPIDNFLRATANPYSRFPTQGSTLLRTWSVKVENPKNVLRYDLLSISSEGESTPPLSFACPGAPPTRLSVGDEVIVLPDDPTPLRIRSTAGTNGRILGEAPANTRLTITDGPVCKDRYVWWRMQSDDGQFDGWGAEGSATQYFIGLEGSTSVVPRTSTGPKLLNPGEAAPALKPGAYLLRFNSPDLSGRYDLQHIMLVATVNVTFKLSERTAMAWVTDLQTGEPVPGVKVNFIRGERDSSYNVALYQLDPVGSATTDADGMAEFTIPDSLDNLYIDMFATVDDGNAYGVSFTGFDDGIAPWTFDQPTDFYPTDQTVYLYTDRSIYRTGQPIYFRGVLRTREDMVYGMDGAKEVFVQIVDPDYSVLSEKVLPVTEFGTFSDKFDVADDGRLGGYGIIVRPGFDPKRDNTENWRGRTYSRYVSVAQYRVPEYQVKAEADKTDVAQGDTVRVTIEGSYFFGGAVSNARVEWSVFADNYYFNYKGPGYYQFYDYNEDEGFRDYYESAPYEAIAQGSGRTDERGRFVVEVPANLGEKKLSQRYRVEGRLIDESDQVIAASATVVVHQGDYYIGAAPQEYVGIAEKPQKINIITANWDSSGLPNQDLNVRVVERRWSSVQTVEPATGRTVWNYEVKEEAVTDGEIRTDADGKAVYEFTPKRGGIYKVYVSGRDSRGNQIRTATFLWVAGKDYVPWRQQNSNRIDLKIDRTDYAVGDTARLLIASPFQGAAKALLTFERGKVLSHKIIDLPTNSTVYEFPITPDMAPNVFVSVMIVKGVDEKNPVAAFRMGLLQFGVEAERLQLNIQITPDKEQAGPREVVNYTVKVTDYKGDPVRAEVGLGLTDLAVLSLRPDTSARLMDHFYSKQGLGVRTGTPLVISVDQQTQEILNTIKGGGGGGAEVGVFEVREKFIDTPLWSPAVVTDQNGEATVSVTLPDQLTTWRLDARAVTLPAGDTSTTLVGQETFDLLSTKPLLIRPVTPRFFVARDEATLVAVVNNNSGADQDVTARIEIGGATLNGDASQTKRITNLGRGRFEWPITVGTSDKVDVTFFASSADGKYTDAAKSAVGQGDDKSLPVYRYQVPETVGTGGALLDGGQRVEGVSLPPRLASDDGTLSVRLDRSLAASTLDSLEALAYFDYYCTEQTISRFLPNVATWGAFSKLGIQDDVLRTQTEAAVSAALQRLYNDQKVDGGWGWFYRERSNPLVTAYALIGLVEARDQGFKVDEGVIESAIRFLQGDLNDNALSVRPSIWAVNRAAFLNYALARADAGNFSRLVRIAEKREGMSLYAKAYLAMAFNRVDPKNTTYTDALVSDMISTASLSATGAHWRENFSDWYNWNTDTRTTAIVLKALVQLQPKNQLVPGAVRWLMSARKFDAWETTQETAWAVMALVDYMQATGELRPNYAFSATLNGTAISGNETATPDNVRDAVELTVQVADLLKGQLNKLVIERSQGDGVLYYTSHLTINLPVEDVKPASRGLSISRTYSRQTDRSAVPISEATVGESLLVTLTIVAPSDLHYVVIEDPIPAGTESVDPQLATTAIGQAPQLSLDNPFGRGWGWWWFSETELRDQKTVLYASYLPRGTYRYTYVIRAGMAGTFHVIPPTGREFYFPEVYGRGAGAIFTIKPAAQ